MQDGILNILKPPGMTSHDVVNAIRSIYQTKKVGHTGTLDPGAAGVLPICIGRGTKVAQYITSSDKHYRGEITLGIVSDTLDSEGKILAVNDASKITETDFRLVLEKFIGKIKQVPPMASAVKIGGKKLYEYQREGLEIDRPEREVEIYEMNLIWSTGWGTKHPRALFDIKCSKGTYIRTLCQDIGLSLNVGAYMSFLLRTQVGNFKLENAYTFEEVKDLENPDKALLSIDDALSHLPKVLVKNAAVKSILSGATLYPPGVKIQPENIAEEQLVRIKCDNELLALGKTHWELQPEKRVLYKPICMIKVVK